jgi:hypothetical protein
MGLGGGQGAQANIKSMISLNILLKAETERKT